MRAFLLATLCGVTMAQAIGAQQDSPSTGAMITRAQIQATIARLEAGDGAAAGARAQQGQEAAALRARLVDGDFSAGDRIVLTVANEPTLSDTFIVLPGRVLAIPGMPELPLGGVLRSELRPRVEALIGRVIREPQVSVHVMSRIGVIGAVARPGYYPVSPDALLADAVMLAGGPATNADMEKATIHRQDKELLGRAAVRNAIARGYTLDQLGLQAGDELRVPEKRRVSTSVVISTMTLLATAVTSIIATTR